MLHQTLYEYLIYLFYNHHYPYLVSHQADLCALWFFIPERFRAKPQDSPGGVFISHAWDLAMWDIRPDPGSVIWLDTLAIVQHRAEVPEGAPAKDAYPELMDLCPTVQSIANTLLILGGDVHGLLPLRRSWCCYELAHTPKGRLRVRAGRSDWNYRGQQEIRQGIDSLVDGAGVRPSGQANDR